MMDNTGQRRAGLPETESTEWTETDSGMATPINLEEVDDTLPPVYLRDRTILRAYLKEKQKQAELDSMSFLRDSRENLAKATKPKPKFKLEVSNLNAWRENTIDNLTIYNIHEDTLKDEDAFPPQSRPPTPEARQFLVKDDLEFKRERTYIHWSRTGVKSAEQTDSQRFWSQTIKQYNRPLENPNDIPYRSPRAYPNEEEEQERRKSRRFAKPKAPLVETISKIPACLKTLPRLLTEVECDDRGQNIHQFCDVLGPGSCSVCLEFANRKIAGEVQKAAFPELDITVTTLVAPKLNKLMILGEQAMKSKKFRIRNIRASILKLPSLEKDKPKFGRAGIEKQWANKAKLFYATQHKA